MVSDTIQFVSQTKLSELHRQRTSLLEEYQQLTDQCEQTSGVEKLAIIYQGLRKVRVAIKPLHMGIQNLEVLLNGSAPPEPIVAFWLQKLEDELARGKLRAEIVYLFGALLGEWNDQDEAKRSFIEERNQAHGQLLQYVANGDAQAPALAILSQVMSGFGESISDVARSVEDQLAKSIEVGQDAWFSLSNIASNQHQPAHIRSEAKRFSEDAVLEQELRDALRVATRDPRDWNWRREGISSRALWTRNKWRLYPTLSLVELCMLNSVSCFWSGVIEKNYSSTLKIINRKGRLQHLEDLQAPDVITLNERRMLKLEEERIDLGWYEPIDPWDNLPPLREAVRLKGIVMRRAEKQAELRDSSAMGYYRGAGENQMVHLVHAEVQTLRAAFPDRPLYIVKLDIRDFFPSVPHRSLIGMLRGLGMPDIGIEFAERFLKVPYMVDGEINPAQRGVPMEQLMSHWLCEWLLRMMERYVHSQSKVRIIRQIDDICLLTPNADDAISAWNAVHQFLADCGLAVNADKCGALALGGELPAGLPAAHPQWGMLQLSKGGDWLTDQATFEKFLSDTRRLVLAKHAVLAKVMAHNSHLKFLVSSLGLAMDLGDAHRDSVNDTLRRFDAEFFSSDRGITRGLQDCIRERYLENTQLAELPESWMLWPITAGGLSLRSANVLSGQFQIAYAEREEKRVKVPTERTDDWQYGHDDWTKYYEDQLVKLEPAACRETKVMKTLVDSFVARGKQISGGEQKGLSEYWRWVLSIYGPEILDKFGTFDFLLTDLVPLQLIHEKLMREDADPQ